jgi:drug/metabolite transporter (DMT)-like permease
MATGALSGRVTGESTNLGQWLGLVLGFIGVALSVGFRIDFNDQNSVFGYLIPLGSVVAITIASLLQRRIELKAESEKLPMGLSIFYQSLATTIALAFPALMVEHLATDWQPEFIYAMLWLILAVSLGAYILMWRLIERLDATRVASLFYLGPPVTMLMAWMFFGDKVKSMDLVGLGVVLAGVLLTQINLGKKKLGT